MTEVYEILNGIEPPIINYCFQFLCDTNNTNFLEIFTENGKTVKYDTETGRIEYSFSTRSYTLNIKTLSPLLNLNLQ